MYQYWHWNVSSRCARCLHSVFTNESPLCTRLEIHPGGLTEGKVCGEQHGHRAICFSLERGHISIMCPYFARHFKFQQRNTNEQTSWQEYARIKSASKALHHQQRCVILAIVLLLALNAASWDQTHAGLQWHVQGGWLKSWTSQKAPTFRKGAETKQLLAVFSSSFLSFIFHELQQTS